MKSIKEVLELLLKKVEGRGKGFHTYMCVLLSDLQETHKITMPEYGMVITYIENNAPLHLAGITSAKKLNVGWWNRDDRDSRIQWLERHIEAQN